MKIWVDAREFTPRGRTGITRYLEHLFSAYVATYTDDIVFLTYYPECIPDTLHQHCQVVALPQRMTAYVDHVLIPQLIGKHPQDIFFSSYYKIPLRGRFTRVCVIHDILFLRRNDLPRWRRMLTLAYLRLCAHKADHILVDSEYTDTDVEMIVSKVSRKMTVLYPDISAFWLEGEATEKCQKVDTPYFLYVGNFNPHKNVPLLIEGFTAFKNAHPADSHILILAGGDKQNQATVQAAIRASGCEKSISWLAGITDEKLKTLYRGATAFITASSYEGFGYPVVEAMACACPVICSADTSLGEISGGCAVSLPALTAAHIGHTLGTVVQLSTQERESLTRRAKEHIVRFSPGTAARHLHALLEANAS